MRARLCLWHLTEECLPPRPGTYRCVCLCNGAAVKLRLIIMLF